MSSLKIRVAAATAVAAACLGLAACAGGSGAAGSAASVDNSAALARAAADIQQLAANQPLELQALSKPPTDDYKVASVTCTISTCYPGEFEQAAAELGWQASEETYDLADGPSAFVAAVQRALQSEPDALAILFGFPPEMIQDEIDQAVDDGVVLIDVASALDAPPAGFIACLYCNPTYAEYGKNMATWVAVDDDGANAGVGVVGDKTIESHIGSGTAATEEVGRLMPGAEVTQVNVSFSQTPQANAQTVITALQRDPDLSYLIYQSPDLLSGLDQALTAAGFADRVKIVAPGPATGEALLSVEQGFPTAWVALGGPSFWWASVDIMARNLVGDEFDPTPVTSTRLVTEENISVDLLAPRGYKQSYRTAWGLG